MNTDTTPAIDTPPAQLACRSDAGFAQWLAMSRGSLAISTYQAGKLLLVGWNGREVSFLPRAFPKPMGLDVQGDRMVLAVRNDVLSLQNNAVLARHYDYHRPGRYDALFLPRLTWHTGELHLHDLALAGERLWVVNTRFSVLCELSAAYTFEPRWRPPFVTDTVPEDRCHLNGLALVDGAPGYVTALGTTDSAGGWRADKVAGGIVMDVRRNEIVLRGLAMPHSPRWHRGALWLVNSGCGELLRWTPGAAQAEVVCTLPGYLRGLALVDDIALVGLCKIREQHIFGGMPVAERFAELMCGIALIDIRTGARCGLLEFTAGCTELYDVRFLPGVQRPNVLNLEREQARQAITASPDINYWLRPENEIKDEA